MSPSLPQFSFLRDRNRGIPSWDMVRKLGRVRTTKTRSGEIRWYVDLRPHARIFSVPGIGALKSEENAKAVLEYIRGEIFRGVPIEQAVAEYLSPKAKPNRVPVKLEKWLDNRRRDAKAGDISPTTLRELERYARPGGVFSWWQHHSIYEIGYGPLEDWNHWLADQDLAPKTRKNILGAFRGFVNWLKRRGNLTEIPEFPTVKVPEYQPTIISPKTQDQVITEIPWERRGAFLAARHGIRPGEIRALDVGDFCYREGTPGLIVGKAIQGPNSTAPTRETKNNTVAWIPIDQDLHEWVEYRLAQLGPEDRLQGEHTLFPNPTARNPGKRWIANSLREEWNRAAKRVGVKVKMYEGTKHSSATAWRASGVPLDLIQRMLRHRDARSTERYARLSNSALVDVIRPNLSVACQSGDDRVENHNDSDNFWRGGRDSNPQLPA